MDSATGLASLVTSKNSNHLAFETAFQMPFWYLSSSNPHGQSLLEIRIRKYHWNTIFEMMLAQATALY
jgi:hypothetical protein